MTAPAFEEIDPVSDCDCLGCVRWRRLAPRPSTARPAGRSTARGAVVMAAAASAVLGAVSPAAALTSAPPRHAASYRPGAPATDGGPASPQGTAVPLHGPGGSPARPQAKTPATTRTAIINRAKLWVDAKVPYSTTAFWSDGYRQDCSGYVSMAWGLLSNEWTGSLAQFAVKITKEELQPGDILLFHNPADPQGGSHVVIFGGWTDHTHTAYTAYEQTPPHTRRQSTPYAYWNNSGKYVPYRYKGVTAGSAGAEPETAPVPFPGTSYFGPGANNKYVTMLGEMLVARGGGSYYATGPGPVWGEADRRATQAFQKAQGWTGSAADGLPGPRTWELLVTGGGKDIASGAASPGGVPAFPGKQYFRAGADNAHVTRLGRQLVKKGFGSFYATGPGPRWGEADRRAVEAFQRAQGWRGGTADGYPGPETWRRLFA
ncbi:peptidoglycan-binding protein [Streptomyces sp. BV129]|uniref:peptidoglycan-binding protein n=1 Tax=Streptomyces sp. BV129 TaxID=2849671 RepID=UPI001C2E0E85|nr:peptidoglycan-binding protein [Streptomyces sp. BV129]MBV1947887.1 peptidoglycan-binding protein [Streptomyces sp. BV129]